MTFPVPRSGSAAQRARRATLHIEPRRPAASCRVWLGVADSSAIYLAALTVTLKDAVPVLALESVAVQRTTVRPIRNRLPDRGTHVAGTWPSTASVALTV